ncbi:MAG: dihydrolipoamide acetyltransferase family protein [Bacteroidales bacterium]
MPKQGQSVESCILTQWFKDVGDRVEPGDVLFSYETDKAAFEEEARDGGVLLARFVEEGEEVEVLKTVAVVGQKGESVAGFGTEREASRSGNEPSGPTPATAPLPVPAPAISPETEDRVSDRPIPDSENRGAISPRARKLAREKRIHTLGMTGSGPGGRIIERDILAAIREGKRMTPLAQKKMADGELALPPEGRSPFGKIATTDLVGKQGPASGESAGTRVTAGGFRDVPLSPVRKIIAAAMHASLQNSAQLTHHMSARATALLALRKEAKERNLAGYPHRITLNDMLCYAVIRALKLHPGANAQFIDGRIRLFDQVNLGLAVDTDRGLLVPALPDAGSLTLPGLSDKLAALVSQARKGGVSPDLLVPDAATFTVSNLGNYGVELFTPVINLPQVAILGINAIVQRPVVLEDGSLAIQPHIGLSLTYDHRALDGGPATLFLAEIKHQIEALNPHLLTP